MCVCGGGVVDEVVEIEALVVKGVVKGGGGRLSV